jgi:outer membrane protein
MLSNKQRLFVCLLSVSTLALGVDVPAAKKDASNVAKKPVSQQVQKKASEESKLLIAVVDVQDVINKTQVDKPFVEALLTKQQEFQKELKAKGEEIQKKEQNLKAKASALSADALKKLYEELDDLRVQANRLAERRQKELQQEEMNTRMKVFQTIQEYAKQLKEKIGVKIVVERNSILTFDDSVDVTSELVAIIKDDVAKKEAAAKKKNNAAKKEADVPAKISKLAAAEAAK